MSKQTNNSSSSSNLSVDSLEDNFIKKNTIKDDDSEDNIDTILVPFYEQDILMKVPKERINRNTKQGRSNDKLKKDTQNSTYLVNNHKAKRTSYLEIFRKQLAPRQKPRKQVEHEIRSLSPEVGDTERESIDEDPNNVATEFYNTESYNEIYYEKLLTHDLNNYLDQAYEETQFAEDAGGTRSPHDMMMENLRSVSEVSQPRRIVRRATTDPLLDNVKLGGLGPDMEGIKPRLERARSLQRYSEKVRMENRLKIYKKSIQAEKDKKAEREVSGSRQRNPGTEREERAQRNEPNASYLLNKTSQPNSFQVLSKLYSKSKSADAKKRKAGNTQTVLPDDKSNIQKNNNNQQSAKNKRNPAPEATNQRRAKSSSRNRGMNTDGGHETPPVHINFMVNVDGVKLSSDLKALEEKHRMYQEQVKAFKMDSGNI